MFFDTEKRGLHRLSGAPRRLPLIPGPGRCGYYDFLSFERRAQNDPEFVAATNHE